MYKPSNRQQMVRRLPLPYEVTEVVNSFLFYDHETARIRRHRKYIVRKFHQACISRARPGDSWYENPDTCEHWSICLTDIHFATDPLYAYFDPLFRSIYEEPQFQATNCQTCGNYKISSSIGYSIDELEEALAIGDQDWAQEVRGRMCARLRCECL
jgi:hypothetical protein